MKVWIQSDLFEDKFLNKTPLLCKGFAVVLPAVELSPPPAKKEKNQGTVSEQIELILVFF